ncbi:MAG: hypothetical protein K6G33_12380 [Ruminococcus sp.]|uniref:hypothetical protein n=1 Tax=Ruminococcus sp. TaxID=41978 RepID=UPI0025F9C990|nr:hypothetical protein [Ruminococcus sp.]MCR5601525.1 hypothetical protein [Ruminococcus sp.]
MADKRDYCELRFTNAIMIDIFGRYATNSEMAEIVDKDGSVKINFRMSEGPLELPDNCEQVLSLMYALFECNPHMTIGRIYTENQQAILRETVYRISSVLDSFSDVELILHSFSSDSGEPSKVTETLKKVVMKRETKTVSITE